MKLLCFLLAWYSQRALAGWVSTLPVSYTSVGLVNSMFPAITSMSTVTSAILAYYCGAVEAEINLNLAKRYTLPLTVECPMLTAIATREAIYRIAVQRALVQFPPAQQGQHPMAMQHKEDQRLLDEIEEGAVELLDSSGALIPTAEGEILMTSTTENYLPTMHEGRWENMIQDQSKLDDIDTDRNIP